MGHLLPWDQLRDALQHPEGPALEDWDSLKKSRRGRRQYGVYCHKLGTMRKCGSYMTFFKYDSFIAAPLLECKVAHPPLGRISCGDQWCCKPDMLQIVRLWVLVVPFEAVGINRYWVARQPWQPEFELCPAS